VLKAKTGASGGRTVLGVVLKIDFQFPFSVTIDAGNVGGPSAGLAFALDIIDELGPTDIDRGERVVATGQIAIDGSVHEIGGVKQKTLGAREAGANVFLVPDGNAATARKYADGLRIVPVSSLDEALHALATR